MKTCAFSLLALAFAGCAVIPRVNTSASDPAAPVAIGTPMPRMLGVDSTTRKTNELLAAVGADNFDGLNPMKMDGMEGMDHSKMPGMSGTKGGAMPEMKSGAPSAKGEATQPANAAATAEEMKKMAEEMKKASDEMKAKSDALKKNREAKPGTTPTPKAGDHSKHQQ